MKTLLVGEAPPRSRMKDSPSSLPFSGSSGRRLSELIGQDVTKAFDTRNLIPDWPGHSHHGSLFPIVKARAGVVEVLRSLTQVHGTRMILAGSRVAKAFKLGHLPYLEWKQVRMTYKMIPGGRHWTSVDVWVAKIPHPSSVNRAWNDPDTQGRVKAFLEEELAHG